MSATRLARACALLARGGLCAPDGRAEFAVYDRPDRRRRPRLRLSQAEVEALVARGDAVRRTDGALTAPDAAPAPRRLETTVTLIADGRAQRRQADAAGSPLARFARLRGGDGRLAFGAREIAAGERLHQDWLLAGFAHVAVSDWTAPRREGPRAGRDPAAAPDRALDARARVRKALAFVGPGLDRALEFACLRLAPFDALERDRAWPRGAGRAVTQIALARLADLYGL